MGNEIQKMLPRHFKLLELFLEGNDRKTVAQAVGMTPEGVGLIYNSPIFQHEFALRRKQRNEKQDAVGVEFLRKARSKIEELTEDAVGVHEEIMRGEDGVDPRTRQMSAEAILDRAFGKPAPPMTERNTGRHGSPAGVIVLTSEKIDTLQLALGEAFEENEKPFIAPPPPPEPEEVEFEIVE